jgi:ferric-dicitrate binding protein FerR (iron transport regulator)
MKDKHNQDRHNWDSLGEEHSPEELGGLWKLSGTFGQSYEPDVEGGLQRLHARLAEDTTAAKRIPLWQRAPWLRIAAAIIGLALIGGWWYQQQAQTEVAWTVVATAADEQRELVLPDGSTVVLNEHTRLSYRNDLATAEVRELELRGEAYFTVTRAPAQPFQIRTAGVDVSVLGTAFNLRAPADGLTAELAVTHGLVAFKLHTATEALRLKKGEVVSWKAGEAPLLRTAQSVDNYRAWYSHSLQFSDTPLSQVLEQLSRAYRIQLEQKEPLSASGDCRLTGRWDRLSATEAMNLLGVLTGLEIEATGPATYRLSGQCEG